MQERKEEDIIAEGNKLIAEFMGCYGSTLWAGGQEVYRYGFKDTHITERWNESEFATITPYHTSWDWLIPVVEKIGQIDITPPPNYEGYRIEIVVRGYVRITRRGMTEIFANVSREGGLIQAIYKAVIDFIKFYNTQSSQTTKP